MELPPLRSYQVQALNLVIQAIKQGQKRILIQMPVGSGKTIVLIKAIEQIFENQHRNSVRVFFPAALLVEYYQRLLNPSTAVAPLRYEYYKRSILISPIISDIKGDSPIYFLDEAYNLEVKEILKQKEVVVIGFYTQVNKAILKAFSKEKPDFSLTIESIVGRSFSTPNLTKAITNGILKKLAIPLDSNEGVAESLLKVDFWVNDYLERTKKDIKDNKTILLESVVSRKESLEEFDKLLNDEKYFAAQQKESKEEKVWQDFFEKNKWIFGLNLNLYFLSSLNGKRYEQVVSGYHFNSGGKRVDGLLKSNGLLSSFHFCEIKTHTTRILKPGAPYRGESYSISAEFAGAIAQTQKTVLKATQTIRSKEIIKDQDGFETDEVIYNYLPQATIVIGSLEEFKKNNKINEDMYSSFELFRKSILNIQIITFDELYQRAQAIVGIAETEL